MKECDAGAARGKKGLSFLRNCLLKKKLADKRKVKTYMKSTQLNEEHIRWLENRVSSLENRSSELEKLDKLIEVQNEIKTVLKEDSGTARERKRKCIMECITNVSQIVVGILTVVFGFFTWQIYEQQLEITRVQNEPVFECFYDVENNELLLKKTNGKIRDVYFDIESVYISSVTDISNNQIIFCGIPFTTNPTQTITPELVGYEEYCISLFNANTRNMQFVQEFLENFKDTKYGCQIDIAYIVEISYKNEYEKDQIETQYFVLKTENCFCENTNGIRISYDGVNSNIYNPVEFRTNQVIQVDESAACVIATRDMRYEYWEYGIVTDNDTYGEEQSDTYDIQLFIEELIEFNNFLRDKQLYK